MHRGIAGALTGVLLWFALAQAASAGHGSASCSGSPLEDVQVVECGRTLPAGDTLVVWQRDTTSPAEAFNAARMLALNGDARALTFIAVWGQDAAGHWQGWSPAWPEPNRTLREIERGHVYVVSTPVALAWSFGATVPRLLERARIVSYYGHPGLPVMGVLGEYAPAEAVREVTAVAREFTALDPDLPAIPALHLIAAVAQRSAGKSGLYLAHINEAVLDEYVRATAEAGALLFLDIQIGWGDPLTEVKRHEDVLLNDHVHVALDPEYATRTDGEPPGQAIGSIEADEINAVQAYLDALADEHHLQRKILVVHQFRDDMVLHPERLEVHRNVDLVIDMDGFGPRFTKLWGYDRFALSAGSAYPAFKLFLTWDIKMFSPEELLAFDRPPAIVIYQ